VQWRCLMTGYKFYSSLDEALWSAQMESTRKDVERAFGILKGRFRCLKLPVMLHRKVDIDNLFWTCVILHNMILTNDGRDHLWEQDMNWNGANGEHDLEDNEWVGLRGMEVLTRRALTKLTDFSAIGRRHYVTLNEIDPDDYPEPAFYVLRKKLIDNYYYLYVHHRDRLEWLN
jgi:hypothetical protein